MGKASELDDWLNRQLPLTPEEKARYEGPRPQLRLRREVVERAVGPDVPVKAALGYVASQGAEAVALRDAESGTTAVVVSLAQYFELVSSYIRDRELAEVGLDGRVVPSDSTFSALGVEQVNPRESWLRIGGYDPGPPTPEG
jgi:hypothetical protein